MSLVFIQRGKRPRIANTALKKKNRVKGPIQLNFKTCCKAALINTCGTAEGIQIDQWNGIESPEIDPHAYEVCTQS